MTLKSGMKGTMAAAVALMVLACSFAVLVTAPSAGAVPISDYSKDKWAIAGERDITLSIASVNDFLNFGYEDSFIQNSDLEELSLAGHGASVMIFEIVGETDDQYQIKVVAAQNISLAAALLLNADLVVPGNYTEDNITDAQTFEGEFGFDAQLAFAVNETVMMLVNKVNMTIVSMDYEIDLYARGNVAVKNIPNMTTEEDSSYLQYYNITDYLSFDSEILLDLYLSGTTTFDPFLQIVADNATEGSSWMTPCYANTTMNWEGMLNITNLPSIYLDEIFSDSLTNYGITGFPIDLAKIYDPNEANPNRINNGTVMLNDTIMMDFYNYENRTIGSDNINVIGFNPMMTILYNSENHHIVGMGIRYENEPLTIDFSMVNTTVADAQKLYNVICGQIENRATYGDLGALPVVVITSPTSAYSTTGTVDVAWDGSDAGSGIAYYNLSVFDGASWNNYSYLDASATHEVLSLEDGSYTVVITAVNLAGKAATNSVSFTVDTVRPTVETSPSGTGVDIDESIIIEFSEAMRADSVAVKVNGVAAPFVWNGNVIAVSMDLSYNGDYTVNVTGNDLAGNSMSKEWSFSTVKVGTIEGVLADKDGNAIVGATVTMGDHATTTDANGHFSFVNVTVGSYPIIFSKNGFEVGNTTATVESNSTDNVGTVTMETLSSSSGSDGSVLIIGLVAAIAIVALVGVFLYTRKPKTP